jgi:hypothetical protein
MRSNHSGWVTVAGLLLFAATVAAQAPRATTSGADEASIRTIVKSIYASYNQSSGGGARGPGYSPSTATLLKQYGEMTRDAATQPLSEFDLYCECQLFNEAEARLLSVDITRIRADVIDATPEYVMFSSDAPRKTRIRFQKSGSWVVHDIFWSDGSSLRGVLSAVNAGEDEIPRPSTSHHTESLDESPTESRPPSGVEDLPTPEPRSATTMSARDAPIRTPPSRSIGAACGGNAHCVVAPTFVATVVGLREPGAASAGAPGEVDVTVRFRNTTGGPLILDYMYHTGFVSDDSRNFYDISAVDDQMGTVSNVDGRVNKLFEIAPGQSRDARFSFLPKRASAHYGSRFVVRLAVREILRNDDNTISLVTAYPLEFKLVAAAH